MHKHGDKVHISDTEASGGRKTGHMRWVLGIGLLLAIALLSIIWISGALSQGDAESEATASGTYAATAGAEQDADSTDSILGDNADEIETPVTD